MNITNTTPEDRFKTERNDCAICALTHISGQSYARCHEAAKHSGRKDRSGTPTLALMNAAYTLDLKVTKEPLPLYALAINGLAYFYPKGVYYVCTARHAFALMNGVVKDNGGIRRREEFIEVMYKVERQDFAALL